MPGAMRVLVRGVAFERRTVYVQSDPEGVGDVRSVPIGYRWWIDDEEVSEAEFRQRYDAATREEH